MSDTPVEHTSPDAAPVEVVATVPATVEIATPAPAPAPAAGVAIELAPVPAPANELTDIQKKAIASLLEKSTEFAKSLIKDGMLGTLSITKLIGYLMKNAETLQVDGDAIKGSDKKKVVLEVGKQLIITYVTNGQKTTVVELYDSLAEPTLEAMIDMSHGVNFTTAALHVLNDKEAQVVINNAARWCFGFC